MHFKAKNTCTGILNKYFSIIYSQCIPVNISLKPFFGNGGVGNAETDILMISWNGFVQWVPEATYS